MIRVEIIGLVVSALLGLAWTSSYILTVQRVRWFNITSCCVLRRLRRARSLALWSESAPPKPPGPLTCCR